MAISRAQMGSQLKGTKMKKRKTKKMALGGIAAVKELGVEAIPSVSIAKSLASGKPEGLLRATPIGQALSQQEAEAKSRKNTRVSGAPQQSTQSQAQSGRMERPQKPTRGMKAGGQMGRGDGCCVRGKTRGRMT